MILNAFHWSVQVFVFLVLSNDSQNAVSATFKDSDSSYSFLADTDPLTSTPKKSVTEQGTSQSEALLVSPLPPPFQLVDEPSIESSATQSEQSTLEVDDRDVNEDSTTNSSQRQWIYIATLSPWIPLMYRV